VLTTAIGNKHLVYDQLELKCIHWASGHSGKYFNFGENIFCCYVILLTRNICIVRYCLQFCQTIIHAIIIFRNCL